MTYSDTLIAMAGVLSRTKSADTVKSIVTVLRDLADQLEEAWKLK